MGGATRVHAAHRRRPSVDKTYETGKVNVHALRGVDLSIARGEMVAIIGPSGCGKTTLLNCLSGLDSIDSGEIEIDGTPLSALSDRQRTDYRARQMGFVFQFYNLMPVLTSVENVELPLLVARVSQKEARERALGALDLVGLGGRADFRLSGFLYEEGPFDPVPVRVRDPQSGREVRLTIIGILADTAPFEMAGISTSQATLTRAFLGRAYTTIFYFALTRGPTPAPRPRVSSPPSSPTGWRRSPSRRSCATQAQPT